MGVYSGLADAVARGGSSAGDVSDEEGGIFQITHAQIGGFLLIADTDQKVAGFRALEGGRIDEDEAILFADGFDDSDEAWDLSLGRRGLAGNEARNLSEPGEQERSLRL